METSPPSRGRANSDGRRASAHLSSPHLAMRSPLPRGGSSPNFGALETLAVPLLPPAYAPPELSPTLVWSYAVGHHYKALQVYHLRFGDSDFHLERCARLIDTGAMPGH